MSFNRENVTWQSKDGTWNMAFFRVTWEGREEEGYDPEWDVEYDYTKFDPHNYATRQESPDAAYEQARKNTANPGGGWVVSRQMDTEACDKYDAMLDAALRDAVQKLKEINDWWYAI
jgi:hypothetical protein